MPFQAYNMHAWNACFVALLLVNVQGSFFDFSAFHFCSSGEFDPGNASCQKCPAGKYQEIEYHLSPCETCPPGKFTEEKGKSSCKVCPPGKFQDQPGDKECKRCLIGRFLNDNGATFSCKSCEPGKFSDKPGLISCKTCPQGKFQDLNGRSVCKICFPGTYQDEEGTESDCKLCEPGKFSNDIGQSSCKVCVSGQFQDNGGKNACEGRPCDRGKFFEKVAQTTGVTCKNCVEGKFQDQTGQTKCKDCPAGKYEENEKQLRCKDCKPGHHQDEVGTKACKTCRKGRYQGATGQKNCVDTTCSQGEESTSIFSQSCVACMKGMSGFLTPAAAAEKNTESCIPCFAGLYQDQAGQTSCKNCPPGKHQSFTLAENCVGTACTEGKFFPDKMTSKVTCKNCPKGKFQSSPEQTHCNDCVGGRFQDETGQTGCKGTPCVAGKYLEHVAQLEFFRCKECAAGQHQDEVGQPGCKGTACTPGTFFETRAMTVPVVCKGCPKGKFQDFTGQRECKNCPAGKYQENGIQVRCKGCAAGQHQDQTAQTDCKGSMCVEGKFFEQGAQTIPVTCKDCVAGQYSDFVARTECKGDPCVTGKYFEQVGQKVAVTCKACGAGEHADVTGLTECKGDPCVAGKFFENVEQKSSVTCKDCVPGKHQNETGQTNCKGTACAKGKFFAAAQTTAVTCKDCVAGQYQWFTGQTACFGTPCVAGKFFEYAGSSWPVSQCKKCPAGYYQEQQGQTMCKACVVGQHQDQTAQADCKGTACVPGKFFSKDAQTSPVTCKDCVSGQHQDQTAQTECKGTSCVQGKFFEQVAQTSAVTCKDCVAGRHQDEVGQTGCKGTACSPGKFFEEVAQTTTVTCKDCVAGQFSDQVEQTGCKDCVAGRHQDEIAQTDCKGTACVAGEYFAAAQTTAVTCKDCPVGKFQDEQGQTNCKDTACIAGRFLESLVGQTSQVCKDCPVGKFQDETTQTDCKGTACAAGKYFEQVGQKAAVTCKHCVAGQHQDEMAQTDCKGTACVAGKFFEQVGEKAAVTCKDCVAGQHQDETGQTNCKGTACVAGKFFEQVGRTSAVTCRDCGTGHFSDQNAQTGCKDCGVGQHQDETAQTACKGNPCVAGKFFAKLAQTTAVTCDDCGAGQHQDQTAQTGCKGSLCAAGKYFAQVAQTAPVNCSECGAGEYADAAGLTECKGDPCVNGKFFAQVAQTVPVTCANCGAGEYADVAGLTECKGDPCVNGTFFAQVAQTAPVTCVNCGAGEYADAAGLTECKGDPCAAGKFFAQVAQTKPVTCANCVAGEYADVEGLTECKGDPCAAGKFFAHVAQTAEPTCQDCEDGKYQDQTAQQTCKTCPAGQYSAVAAAVSCIECLEGKYQDQAGQTNCKDCLIDNYQYQDQKGKIECKSGQCDYGKHLSDTKTGDCTVCPSGKYGIKLTNDEKNYGDGICHSCATGRFVTILPATYPGHVKACRALLNDDAEIYFPGFVGSPPEDGVFAGVGPAIVPKLYVAEQKEMKTCVEKSSVKLLKLHDGGDVAEIFQDALNPGLPSIITKQCCDTLAQCNGNGIVNEKDCSCKCFEGFKEPNCNSCTDQNKDYGTLCDSCKTNFRKNTFGKCSLCKFGYQYLNGNCNNCLTNLNPLDKCKTTQCTTLKVKEATGFIETLFAWDTANQQQIVENQYMEPFNIIPRHMHNTFIKLENSETKMFLSTDKRYYHPNEIPAGKTEIVIKENWWIWTITAGGQLPTNYSLELNNNLTVPKPNLVGTAAVIDKKYMNKVVCSHLEPTRKFVLSAYMKHRYTGSHQPCVRIDSAFLEKTPTGADFTILTPRSINTIDFSGDIDWVAHRTTQSNDADCAEACQNISGIAWVYNMSSQTCLSFEQGSIVYEFPPTVGGSKLFQKNIVSGGIVHPRLTISPGCNSAYPYRMNSKNASISGGVGQQRCFSTLTGTESCKCNCRECSQVIQGDICENTIACNVSSFTSVLGSAQKSAFDPETITLLPSEKQSEFFSSTPLDCCLSCLSQQHNVYLRDGFSCKCFFVDVKTIDEGTETCDSETITDINDIFLGHRFKSSNLTKTSCDRRLGCIPHKTNDVEGCVKAETRNIFEADEEIQFGKTTQCSAGKVQYAKTYEVTRTHEVQLVQAETNNCPDVKWSVLDKPLFHPEDTALKHDPDRNAIVNNQENLENVYVKPTQDTRLTVLQLKQTVKTQACEDSVQLAAANKIWRAQTKTRSVRCIEEQNCDFKQRTNQLIQLEREIQEAETRCRSHEEEFNQRKTLLFIRQCKPGQDPPHCVPTQTPTAPTPAPRIFIPVPAPAPAPVVTATTLINNDCNYTISENRTALEEIQLEIRDSQNLITRSSLTEALTECTFNLMCSHVVKNTTSQSIKFFTLEDYGMRSQTTFGPKNDVLNTQTYFKTQPCLLGI